MTGQETTHGAPHVTFACELEPGPLAALFADPTVVEQLRSLDATVALGLLDLSAERAAVARRLQEAGVPLVAWLLLPKEEGYWFNASNTTQAAARYDAFRAWTAEHGLRWTGIGFDVEPDYEEMGMLVTGQIGALLPRLFRRLFDRDTVPRAERAYAALVGRARADGYRVESYHFPFIADERRAGSWLLRRAFQLVDVPADTEVFMLYTSFTPGIGPGILWSYAPDAGGIGVGSTGGGVELPGEPPPLTWKALARDLRLARRWSGEVFIFSLEGCVRHGYLARLIDFDWNAPVAPPQAAAARADTARRLLRGLLWASARPGWVTLGLAATLWLAARLRRRRCA
jgi:hypothetical protein